MVNVVRNPLFEDDLNPEKQGWNFLILEAEEEQSLTSIQITNRNTHAHATIGIADLVLDLPDE